jgi:hypothetical protein
MLLPALELAKLSGRRGGQSRGAGQEARAEKPKKRKNTAKKGKYGLKNASYGGVVYRCRSKKSSEKITMFFFVLSPGSVTGPHPGKRAAQPSRAASGNPLLPLTRRGRARHSAVVEKKYKMLRRLQKKFCSRRIVMHTARPFVKARGFVRANPRRKTA